MRSEPRVYRLETADGRVVARHVQVAESMWSRFKGLMLRDQLEEGEGLCLRPCSSIHMFFMKFPLDVAFVNGEGEILHALHGIRPWRMSRMVFGAKAALELPAGALRAAGLGKGDVIRMEDSATQA